MRYAYYANEVILVLYILPSINIDGFVLIRISVSFHPLNSVMNLLFDIFLEKWCHVSSRVLITFIF